MCGCGRQIFVEKTFMDRLETSKFMKVFSLESFPLYGSTCLSCNLLSDVSNMARLFFFKGPEVLVAPSHSLGPPQDYSVMIHFCNR